MSIALGLKNSQVEEEIRKPRTGINKIEDRKRESINKTRSWFFLKKHSKTDEPLQRLMKKKGKNYQYKKTPKQTNSQGWKRTHHYRANTQERIIKYYYEQLMLINSTLRWNRPISWNIKIIKTNSRRNRNHEESCIY